MAVEIDIEPPPAGAYRLAVWTVGPAIERKYARLEALRANVIVAARSGNESRLVKANRLNHSSMAWIGRHIHRGLGALAFKPSFVKLDGGRWDQRLEWIAPLQVNGPVSHQVLAVWALNEKAQVTFKTNPPASQPIQMMRLYERYLTRPTVVAGDFNNNPVFHKNDPNWDMLEMVALLDAAGLTSVYHAYNGLDHGDPRETPTRLKPDRELGVIGHHVDYCFVPTEWLSALINVQLGSNEVWAKSGRTEEHIPLVADFDAKAVWTMNKERRDRRR